MKKTIRQTLPSILLTLLITIVFLLIYKTNDILGIIGVALSSWIICNVVVTLITNIKQEANKKNIFSFSSLKYLNGMIIAHLGVGLLILGITGSSVWQEEKITRMKINDNVTINKYNIVFKEINKLAGPNYYALEGSFWVYDTNNNIVTVLKPENRIYPITNNTTTEVSIHTNLLRDLYIVLGEGDINNGWVVRIYCNPLVVWIWIGVFVIFVGGLLVLKNNLNIIKRKKL